jgi:hypothetical protein
MKRLQDTTAHDQQWSVAHVSAVLLDHEDDECVQQSITLNCAFAILKLLIVLQ